MICFQRRAILLAAAMVFVLGLGCDEKEGKAATAAEAAVVTSGEGAKKIEADKKDLPSDEVQITYQEVEVGTTIEISMKSTMKAKTMAKMGKHENEVVLDDEELKKTRITLLPDEKGATKRASIEVIESYAIKVNPDSGKRQFRENSIRGKTYTVSVVEGETKVMTADGKEAPEQEASAIRAHYEKELEKDPTMEWMASRKFKKDEEVELPAEVVASITVDTGEDENSSVEKATVTLTEVKVMNGAEVAVFDPVLKMTGTEGNDPELILTWELGGNLTVDVATGRIHDEKLEGSYDITTTDDRISVEGHGDLAAVISRKYRGKN